MSDQLYRLYNYVGAMISRTGLVRHIGLATLAAKVDILLRRSLGSVATSPIMLDGVELHFPAEGHFDIELTNAGAFEPRTTRLLLNHLKPGMTFVDVGAHIGHFALVAASVLQEDGHVYAFEPDPVSFSFLQKNIAANGYDAVISPAQKAVADTVGEVKLHSGRRDRLENTIIAGAPAAGARSVTCEVTSLDAFFAQQNWPPVHIIKIDVEGAEYQVLRGMVELSGRNRDLQIIMEFHPENIHASRVSIEQFFHALMALGFRKVSVIGDELVPVVLPEGIPTIIQTCRAAPYVNILCQR